jgi:hypothetical protein
MRGEIQDAGILGYLAASCDSLVEAVARLQRFEPLLQNLSHSWVKIKQDHIYIGWEGSGNESTVLSNDVLLYVLKKFIRFRQRSQYRFCLLLQNQSKLRITVINR